MKSDSSKLNYLAQRGILVFLIFLFSAGNVHADFDPVAEVAAKLQKARDDKSAAENKLSIVNSKLDEVRRTKGELVQTKDRLDNLTLRLKGIQLWNAFVGVMGVANDAITKVNPGSSVATAIAGFAQDRAFNELGDQGTYMQAKIKKFPESITSLSGKMKNVQTAMNLSAMEVAKKLVDEGAVQLVPTPLIRMPFTKPLDSIEAVSESMAVVTGKVRYIQESLPPAIAEISQLITDMDDLIKLLEAEQTKQESLLKQANEAVHDWERQLTAQEGVKKDKELKDIQDKIAKAQAALSSIPSTWIKYTPLDRSILNVMRSAYYEIKSSGRAGYDGKRLQALYKDYDDLKKTNFEKWSKAYEDARTQVDKRAEAIGAACKTWTAECAVRYDNEVNKARDYLWRSYSSDRDLYDAEEKEVVAQAVARSVKMNEYLDSGMNRISSQFMTQYDAVIKELNALKEMRKAKAARPPFDRFPSFFIASQSRRYNGVTAEKPGNVTAENFGQYTELEGWRTSVADGITVLTELVSKEEALFKKLEQAIDVAWTSYDQFSPDNMYMRVKQKPAIWNNDPNRYYGSDFQLYSGGFSLGQIDVRGYGFKVSLPAMSMSQELKWFKEFLEGYDADMPIVEGFLIDDARGLKVERIGSDLIDSLNEYNFGGDWEKEKEIALKRFTFKDKKPAPGISPDESDGARYLEQMKAAWEAKKNDIEEIMKAFKQNTVSKLVYNYKNPFRYKPAIDLMTKIPEKIKLYEDIYNKLKEGSAGSGKDIVAVKELYGKFKDAYESKDDSKIMSFMGDSWEAGDGTTLSDLQGTLRKSFGIFDEIKYNLQNLTVKALQDGRYAVSYDITITSIIFDGNLKHEEKSSVNEVVTIDTSGKPRISETMSGRFWYVE